ncbi:uncharacterized protein LOC130211998 isoform X7 [Pseudoliparis swirei]|nr:uncharacterized protein LOC130211998 isoform X7 [Pseudoliparis swirei]
MGQLRKAFIELVKANEGLDASNYRQDMLKKRLARDFPQLVFHIPTKRNICELVFAETLSTIDITKVSSALGTSVCSALIGIHTFSGCDSTSAFYGKGKKKTFSVACEKDVQGRARLADFGISRRLVKDQTSYPTRSAGTKCWMAKETLADGDIPYKSSTDIQVAGMLSYYILSGGHHPFGDESYKVESNIYEGLYTLGHVQDVVAKDLIEWMIDKEPKNRPQVEECLSHPFFWSSTKRVQYLIRIGNKDEAKKYRTADQELLCSLDKWAPDGSFKQWQTKFSSELVNKMDTKNKAYPDNTLGLRRFIRNLDDHHAVEAAQVDVLALFPDLFGCVFKFAKTKGWNSETPLKEMFQRKDISSTKLTIRPDADLGVPVQESQPGDLK